MPTEMSRTLFFVLLIGLSLLFATCRCAEDGDSSGSSGEGSDTKRLTGSHETVTESGEVVVKGPSKLTSKAPPLLPGEKRRPRGRAAHPEPSEPDPEEGEFTLEEATEGLEGDGPLVAVINANLARMHCTLHAEKAPNAVANFVGLARGKRPWWDPYRGEWVRRPFYNGLNFHKVIPGVMIRGGCPLSEGTGGPGYTIEGETDDALGHDEAGVLSLVASEDGEIGSQFIILDGAAPHFNGRHSVIGTCEPTDAIFRIARVPQGSGNRPLTDVMIRSVSIERGE